MKHKQPNNSAEQKMFEKIMAISAVPCDVPNHQLNDDQRNLLKYRRKYAFRNALALKEQIRTMLNFDCDTDYAIDENTQLRDISVPFDKKLQKFPFPLDMVLYAKMLRAKKYFIRKQSKTFLKGDQAKTIEFHFFVGVVDGKPVLFAKKYLTICQAMGPFENNEPKQPVAFTISLYAILGGNHPINLYRFDSNYKKTKHTSRFQGIDKLIKKVLLCDEHCLQEQVDSTICCMPLNFEDSDFDGQHEHWYNILHTSMFADSIGHGDTTPVEIPLTFEQAKIYVNNKFNLTRCNFKTSSKTCVGDIVKQIAQHEKSKKTSSLSASKTAKPNPNDEGK